MPTTILGKSRTGKADSHGGGMGTILCGVLTLLLLSAEVGVAQRRVAPDSLRHIQDMTPRSGPPGTLVSIHTENLPLQGSVHIGVGAVGAGFETLAQSTQGEWGEISASVRIPLSARWDQPLFLIIFNGNFSPTGISDPFLVTNAEGMVRRRGRITDEGVYCVTMRDEDDTLYTLTGELGSVQPGDEVVAEGVYVDSGACPLGSTIADARLVVGRGSQLRLR